MNVMTQHNPKKSGIKAINSYGKLLKTFHHSQISISENLKVFDNKIIKIIAETDWSSTFGEHCLNNIEVLISALAKYGEAYEHFNNEVEKIKFETNEELKQTYVKLVKKLKEERSLNE